jgi:hypothetical protein
MLLPLLNLLLWAAVATAASLQQVSGFGSNPTNIRMFIYVPDRVAANPAIIVAVCNKKSLYYCSPAKAHLPVAPVRRHCLTVVQRHWSSGCC